MATISKKKTISIPIRHEWNYLDWDCTCANKRLIISSDKTPFLGSIKYLCQQPVQSKHALIEQIISKQSIFFTSLPLLYIDRIVHYRLLSEISFYTSQLRLNLQQSTNINHQNKIKHIIPTNSYDTNFYLLTKCLAAVDSKLHKQNYLSVAKPNDNTCV